MNPMTFFVAWSPTFSAAPIPTQTFTLNSGQERQFVDWYTNADTLAFAKAHPGQLYIIGDEPDQFCQSPTEYAHIYHAAIVAIRAVDRSARFSPAGFAEPNSHCVQSATYDKSWDDAHSISYAAKFAAEYVRLFGNPPPVAEWRFHDFALTIATGDVEAWWSRVDKMAAWSVAHGAKMYLGSWGFLGWSQPTQVLQSQMQQMMTRLQNDDRIVGAAWWSLGPWEDSTHPLLLDGKLTPLGETYTSTGSTQETPMTDMEKLQEAVRQLQEIVGVQYSGKSSDELAAALVPASALPGGRYPLVLSDYQLHLGVAKVKSDIMFSWSNG